MTFDARVTLNDIWEKHCEAERQLNQSAAGQAHIPASEGGVEIVRLSANQLRTALANFHTRDKAVTLSNENGILRIHASDADTLCGSMMMADFPPLRVATDEIRAMARLTKFTRIDLYYKPDAVTTGMGELSYTVRLIAW